MTFSQDLICSGIGSVSCDKCIPKGNSQRPPPVNWDALCASRSLLLLHHVGGRTTANLESSAGRTRGAPAGLELRDEGNPEHFIPADVDVGIITQIGSENFAPQYFAVQQDGAQEVMGLNIAASGNFFELFVSPDYFGLAHISKFSSPALGILAHNHP